MYNINNFMYFEIVLDGAYAIYPTADFDGAMRGSKNETRISIPMGSANSAGTIPYWGTRNLHIKIDGTSFKYARGNTFVLHNNGTLVVYENPSISKILGVRRKW